MGNWIETYRGSVAAWECDVTEHFTIAYYFDRLDEASPALAERLGLADSLRTGGFPRRIDVRFAHELRAGDSFHIDSAALGLDTGLRLGHRVIGSANGDTLTWIEERWDLPAAVLGPQRRAAIERDSAAWDGPAVEERPEPANFDRFIPTARGRVKPGELDETGRLSLSAFIHRFTHCSLQIGAAIGMTAEYMQAARRAYSTFELGLRIARPPALGEPFRIDTGVVHLGNSSLRFLHRMCDARTGEELARLGQFGVQLDLDARRPAKLPDELRSRAQRLVAPLD